MDDEMRALRAACTTFLASPPTDPAALLATIPADVRADTYGEGGVVAELEAHVATLLGKPAAAYLPSGTMAQAAVLRVLSPARPILWHATCHLENHELDAYARVHGLVRRVVGSPERWVGAGDLPAEDFGALVVELPMRELGGVLTPWDDLVALAAAVRERGAALHLDGARLWEASAGYGRPPADVTALFDTAYVSFYKGIGALAGCCVVGPEGVIGELREWRSRLGGTLFGLWPGAASALSQLDARLAEMPGRLAAATATALALQGVPGVCVTPDPPQTPMMHLLLTVDPEAYAAHHRALAETGVWAWAEPAPTTDPRVLRVELGIHPGTPPADQVAAAVRALVGGQSSSAVKIQDTCVTPPGANTT